MAQSYRTKEKWVFGVITLTLDPYPTKSVLRPIFCLQPRDQKAAAMLGDNQAFKMAASGGVPDVNTQYSDYFAGLEGPAKLRYQEKITVCGFDPYALR